MKMPKTECCEVNGPNVRNPNYIVWISDFVRNPNVSTTERFSKTPKSERSDFGALLYATPQPTMGSDDITATDPAMPVKSNAHGLTTSHIPSYGGTYTYFVGGQSCEASNTER